MNVVKQKSRGWPGFARFNQSLQNINAFHDSHDDVQNSERRKTASNWSRDFFSTLLSLNPNRMNIY